MVEMREIWRMVAARWRSIALLVLGAGAFAAFYWAIGGNEAWRNESPPAERVQTIGYWIFGIVFLAWFGLALRRLIEEWRVPADQVVAKSRFEIASENLISAFSPAMPFLIFLPSIALLVDHQIWLKLLATAPMMAFGLYGVLSRTRVLIRDWRAGEAAA